MTTTGLDLVTGAARLLGVVRKGEALDADEANDGLISLNEMLDSWSNNSLLIYAKTLESFTFASSATSYLIGSGQTFNTIRPMKIIHASIRSNGVDYDLEIVSDEEFESIPVKSTQGSPSGCVAYNNAYPYGTLRFYTLPAVGDILRLLSEKPLANLTLSATVDLPPGAKKAIRSNLALDLGAEYGVEPSPLVVKMATESLGLLKLASAKNQSMPYLPSESQGYSILTGVDS